MQILSPGTRIGQYEIASLPMMGGMGVVYFALDHGNDGRPVALKTFRPELLPDRAARDRFLREGTAWVELGSHPHIVRCYKVEYIDPTAFLVLELIAKEQNMPDASLRSWLIPGHPLPLEQALLFALQIARGMQYATEKIPGFVHRDLKPENILVGADKLPETNINRLRVTDFGLVKTITGNDISAKAEREEQIKPNKTQFTRGAGTPLYMAPEQWMGATVGVYTDVYALGCILFEMLIGEHAAQGCNISELQAEHCGGKLKTMPEDLPSGVKTLIGYCLGLSGAERYQSWEQVAAALEKNYEVVSGETAPKEMSMAQVSRQEREQEIQSYSNMGLSYLDLGKAEVAANYFEKALMLAREIDDRFKEGATLGNLGNAYRNLGDTHRAIDYYEQALSINRDAGDARFLGVLLACLGGAYLNLGDTRRGIGYYEQSLVTLRELGERHLETAVLNNLGIAYNNLGDVHRAIGYYEDALVIAREIGNRRIQGNALSGLGSAYMKMGDVHRAIGYYEDDLVIAREIGNRSGEETALGNLGSTFFQLNDNHRAIGYYEEALEIAHEIGDRIMEATFLNNLGGVHLDIGDAHRAIECHEQALAIAREIGNRREEGTALDNLGSAYMELDDVQRAPGYHEQALAIAREIGDRQAEADTSWNLGEVYEKVGNLEKAISAMQVCVDFERAIGHSKAEIRAAKIDNLRSLLESGMPVNPLNDSTQAFVSASSLAEMQAAVAHYPFMTSQGYIQVLEQFGAQQVPPELKPAFEQHIDWLKQLAKK